MLTMIHGDSRRLQETLGLGHDTVDLVITSPPYWEKDGYSDDLIHDLGGSLHALLKPGKLAFINFGDIGEEPGRVYKIQAFHPHKFPDELVKRCILLSGETSGLLLDPFAGGGTTLTVGHSLGFNAIGVEHNDKLVKAFQLKVTSSEA